jgi:hypothetical protein
MNLIDVIRASIVTSPFHTWLGQTGKANASMISHARCWHSPHPWMKVSCEGRELLVLFPSVVPIAQHDIQSPRSRRICQKPSVTTQLGHYANPNTHAGCRGVYEGAWTPQSRAQAEDACHTSRPYFSTNGTNITNGKTSVKNLPGLPGST